MAERMVMPCVPLRGLSVFPHTILHFDIGRGKSVKALEAAMTADKQLFLTSQKDENILIPTPEDYYAVGTVVKIKQMLKIQGDAVRVLVEGQYRAVMSGIATEEPYIMAEITEAEIVPADPQEIEVQALMRSVLYAFDDYMELNPGIKDEVYELISAIEEPDIFADTVAMQMDSKVTAKQEVLEAFDVKQRLEIVDRQILEENQILAMERDISERVQEAVKQNQKEYILREQMKVIQDELGYGEEAASEAERWNEQLEKLKLDVKIEEKVKREIAKFTKMAPSSAESGVIRNYVETILELPWNKSSRTNADLKKAERILNEDHYGLEKVKERILEYLAVIHLNKAIKGPIICLVGPPGVGKTSIARSIARATGREFVRMSLGGVRDEAEIRGHRRTYIGAIPGRIITSIKDAGKDNPVFLFDEVDKIGADFKGDPASALLEVLDPEQNKEFTDHFLDIPFDLSKVMFITTANSTEIIPRPLLDRMEVISVPGYTEEEKVKIAQQYLIPKQLRAHGLKPKNFLISEKAIHELINDYTRESGVRLLERQLGKVCRKTAMRLVDGGEKRVNVTPDSLRELLGVVRYQDGVHSTRNQVGVVNGLAWTEVGGEILEVEAGVMEGSGKLELTGNLGTVMQESVRAALTCLRSRCGELDIEKDFYKTRDIHVHFPEGAVPKDGPSAGIAITTAMLSALTGRKVRGDVAMTGEVTLRGRVLPIGGLKEKTMAALRSGIRTVILPKDNVKDLEEIDQTVRTALHFVPVESVDQVFAAALVPSPAVSAVEHMTALPMEPAAPALRV